MRRGKVEQLGELSEIRPLQKTEVVSADFVDVQAERSLKGLYDKVKDMYYANKAPSEADKLEMTRVLEAFEPGNYIEYFMRIKALEMLEKAGGGEVRDHFYGLTYQEKLYNGTHLLEMDIADSGVRNIARGGMKGVVCHGEVVSMFKGSTENNLFKCHNELLAERSEVAERLDESVKRFVQYNAQDARKYGDIKHELLRWLEQSGGLIYFDLTKVWDDTPKELVKIMDRHNSKLLAGRAVKEGKSVKDFARTKDETVRDNISKDPSVVDVFLDVDLKRRIESVFGFHFSLRVLNPRLQATL